MAAALRRGDGHWLMHRRPAHKDHGGLWEFPGGKVETHETPVSALVRELEEELGIAIRPGSMKPLAFAHGPSVDGALLTVILLYSVDEWSGEPRALEEGAAIGWFAHDGMAALDRPPLDVDLCEQIFAAGMASGASR